MNFLEKFINGIYQRRLLKKKEKEERRKVELEERERVKKIYQAISDFIKSDNFDISKYGPRYDEYEFNLGKIKVLVEMYSNDRAIVSINSIWLNAPYDLERELGAEIVKLVKEEEKRIMKKVITEVEKKS